MLKAVNRVAQRRVLNLFRNESQPKYQMQQFVRNFSASGSDENRATDTVKVDPTANASTAAAFQKELKQNMEVLSKWNTDYMFAYFDQNWRSSPEGKNLDFNTMNKVAIKEITNYQKYLKDGIISGHNFISDIKIYFLLQNPLLAKYNFQPKEFLYGCENALIEVREALISESYYKYANNIDNSGVDVGVVGYGNTDTDTDVASGDHGGNLSHEPNKNENNDINNTSDTPSKATSTSTSAVVDHQSADFLKSVLYPSLYIKCVEALREIHNHHIQASSSAAAAAAEREGESNFNVKTSTTKNSIGWTELPLNIDIHKSSIIDIAVRIVTKDEVTAIEDDNLLLKQCYNEEKNLIMKHKEMMSDIAKIDATADADTVDTDTNTNTNTDTLKVISNTTAGHLFDEAVRAYNIGSSSSTNDNGIVKLINPLFKQSHVGDMSISTSASANVDSDSDDSIQLPIFPVGSVVVDVKVQFMFTPQTDNLSPPGTNNRNSSSIGFHKYDIMEWVFSGCLSDHAETEYKITSFGMQ